MKAVYFPFTFMSGSVLDGCCRFFKEIVIVQAARDSIPGQMRVWQAEGLLDIQTPELDQGNITAMLRDYYMWAANHQGADISAYKVDKHKVPFFDDTSIAQIKKEIRTAGAGDGTGSDSAAGDLLLQARLFLQMAQGFDEQSLEIVRNLKDQEEKERNLFDGLRGEGALSPTSKHSGLSPLSDNPFNYMLYDRLRAWVRVMSALDIVDNLFITNSRETVELAVDDLQNTDVTIHTQRIPGFAGQGEAMKELKAEFMSYLINLSRMSPPQIQENSIPQFSVENGDERLTMELVTIFGIPPPDFFSRFLQKGSPVHGSDKDKISIKNTILGLIEPVV
jgi:hypothetical protein